MVASRHDLRLRTITRAPCGHSFGAGSLNAWATSVATGAARFGRRASCGGVRLPRSTQPGVRGGAADDLGQFGRARWPHIEPAATICERAESMSRGWHGL